MAFEYLREQKRFVIALGQFITHRIVYPSCCPINGGLSRFANPIYLKAPENRMGELASPEVLNSLNRVEYAERFYRSIYGSDVLEGAYNQKELIRDIAIYIDKRIPQTYVKWKTRSHDSSPSQMNIDPYKWGLTYHFDENSKTGNRSDKKFVTPQVKEPVLEQPIKRLSRLPILQMDNSNEQNASQFIVFDIETTGFSVPRDKIIQIAAVKFKNGKEVGTFNEYINPEMNIPYYSTRVHGITNHMVKGKDTYPKVLTRFHEFIRNDLLVAHNASFDFDRFLKYYMGEMGIKLKNDCCDTMAISKRHIPKGVIKNYKLDTLVDYFNITLLQHHDALHDAKATGYLFLRLQEVDQALKTQETTMTEVASTIETN